RARLAERVDDVAIEFAPPEVFVGNQVDRIGALGGSDAGCLQLGGKRPGIAVLRPRRNEPVEFLLVRLAAGECREAWVVETDQIPKRAPGRIVRNREADPGLA